MHTSNLKLKLIKGEDVVKNQNQSFAWSNLYDSIINEDKNIKLNFLYEVKMVENQRGQIINAILMTNAFCGYIYSCSHVKSSCYTKKIRDRYDS